MSNNCKYYKQQKQVSYDSGQTWSNVSPAEYQVGRLKKRNSPDCQEGETIIRWKVVPGDFLCEGKDKYQKEVEQYSTDGGYTWNFIYPTTYRKGSFIESNSEICDNKWEGHYADNTTPSPYCPPQYNWVEGIGCVYVDPIKVIRCSSSTSTTLTQNEVSYYPYTLVSGVIGDCVTSIDYRAFAYCTGLTSIDIPSGVTSIGIQAFQNCTSLTSVVIPNSVTTIDDDAFEYCTSLSSVTIPSGVTFIGYDAFRGCSGLTSITIEATTPPTLENRAFLSTNNCPIYVPCDSVNTYILDWGGYANRILGIPPCEPVERFKIKSVFSGGTTYSAGCSSNTTITTGDTKPSGYGRLIRTEIGYCATEIDRQAFQYCYYLSSCTIGNNVTTIDDDAFAHCTSLSSITIPDSVTSIGIQAFQFCTSLSSITIPDSVTSIGYTAFTRCDNLTDCLIGNGVTVISSGVFQACSGLTNVTIGSGVTSIGENATTPPSLSNLAFYNASNTFIIYVPSSAVDTYKAASGWSDYASRIQAIPT